MNAQVAEETKGFFQKTLEAGEQIRDEDVEELQKMFDGARPNDAVMTGFSTDETAPVRIEYHR